MWYKILDCLKRQLNEEAKSIFQDIENFSELIDIWGLTLLHYAVKYGNAEMTQYLINEGSNVNAQDDNGVSPLMLAIKAKDVKVIKILLKNNADIYLTDREDKNSLELAFHLHLQFSPLVALKNNAHCITEMLFEKFNCDFSKGKLAHFLLNASDSLKLAIVVYGNKEITRFTLENGYPMDFHEPKRGFTALHCVIMLAKFENAKILIKHGANVNALDNDERSPLNYYVFHFEDVDEESEVLQSFLRYSTRLFIPDRRGITEVEKLLLFGKKKTVKTVLQRGIDVDKCSKKDKPLLFCLLENSNFGVYNLLDELHIKFDVNKRDADGRTALMEAARFGCPKRVEFLLKHQADANMTSRNGSSALLNALNRQLCSHMDPEEEIARVKIVQLLLQYHVDVQSFFNDTKNCISNSSPFVKIMVAHLAILKTLERSSLTDSCRKILMSRPLLSSYFNSCVQQLEEMKHIQIFDIVTLFKLLTDSEEKIVAYTRNQEFFAAYNREMKNWNHFEAYYVDTLQKRVSKALDIIKLHGEGALVHRSIDRPMP